MPWLLASAAALLALAAFIRARRVSKRLERLTQSYWELRYEHSQLRARLERLAPEASPAPLTPPTSSPGGGLPAAAAAFVPLSSLKR